MTDSIVTFDDAIPFMPIEKIVANIVPKQDLNGYDAPWAGGAGLNKLPKANLDDTSNLGSSMTVTIADDGSITLNGNVTANATITIPFSAVMPAGDYTWFAFNPVASSGVSISLRTSNKGLVSNSFQLLSSENVSRQFTVASDSYYWRIQINADTTLNNFTFKPMLCVGSVESANYAPYSNICPISGWTGLSGWVEEEYDPTEQPTFTVTWQTEAGTVYGGTVDVVTGVLTADMPIVDMGTLGWVKAGAFRGFVATTNLPEGWPVVLSTDVIDAISDYYKTVKYNDISSQTVASMSARSPGTTDNKGLAIKDPSLDSYYDNFDATAFAAAVSGRHVVFKSTVPQTYQLTPQQISTLLGNNTVFVDTGDVSVTYQSTSGSTPVRTSFKSPLKSYSYNALKLFGNTFIEHGKG